MFAFQLFQYSFVCLITDSVFSLLSYRLLKKKYWQMTSSLNHCTRYFEVIIAVQSVNTVV